MKHTRIFTLTSLLVALGLLISSAGPNPVAAQDNEPQSPAGLQIENQKLTWQVNQPYGEARLVIISPDGTRLERSFTSGQSIELLMSSVKLADGGYRYELLLLPVIDPFLAAQLRLTGEDTELRAALSARIPQPSVVSGAFSVQGGAFAQPLLEGGNQTEDIVQADDVIVTGSLCIGYDCLTDGTENFGFDTIKLKENNTQIYFDDTSATAGFPANDWRIVANDSSSGGANYLAIQDSTGGRVPFKVMAGARNNALFISSTGRVGLGTGTPVLNLHIVHGDTPSIRLEQDTSSGWSAQTWDMAGNESNFFLRDTTGGSKLPFRIQTGTPTNTLTLKSDGKVGIGTWSPVETLHVVGNIRADGYVIEYSDVNAKENFAKVDGASVLDKIAALPISSWNYRTEADSVRHIGPMAQDFFAAFGLGTDNKHIAALDTNGVTLAAIQELIRLNQTQQAEINALRAKNAELEARLERLEKALLP
jgi:hypothetical protein